MKEKLVKHKKLVAILVILIIVAILASILSNSMKRKQEMALAAMNQSETAFLERRTLVSSISATGVVTSVESKELSVNLTGVEVEKVMVEVGDMVEAGQILCEFNSEDIEENLAEAKTSLNVANQKTQMDLTTAERNLEDAREDYDTDLKRGNTDLGVAYNDYVEALEDVDEAKADWDEAKATTIEKKGEMELREEQLSAKQAQINAAGTSAMYESEFANSRKKLAEYLEQKSVTIASAAMDKIGLGNDLSKITVGDNSFDSSKTYDFSTSETEVQTEINDHIKALIGLQTSYKNSLKLEQEYASIQQELSTWQTKYNTAKQNESSYEKAYEQAVSASESQLQAYDKQKRTLEDTTKSAENAVITKTESLTTAQLNALSSGNTEEDKVEQYQQQLDDCTVEAPISGVISAVNVEVGDTYNGTAIMTIDDISAFEVAAEIDEYDIGKIEKGQKVVIKTNATGDEELEGTVKNVSPKASTGGNEVTYTAIISVDTPNEMLRMDMTAKLSIILESKENVLTVPYEAVQEDENGKYYVEVVNKSLESSQTDLEEVKKEQASIGIKEENTVSGNGQQMQQESNKENTEETTVKVYVEKGIESDYYIEIISDEISEGMEVVVPKSDSENSQDIQMMIMNQGPMGGF